MYDIVMALLAIVAVLIAFLDIAGKLPTATWIVILENAIWVICIADYVIRFIIAKSKKDFFKQNIFDLISILPFSSFLRVFRVAKLLRLTKLTRITKATKLIRLFAFFGRFGGKAKKFLSTNGLIYVLYINIGIIFLGAIGIYFAESGEIIHNFADAIWWSFVTTTTVGYGDISPSTGIGRIIAVILMLTGIGTIGMLTSTLSTYFIKAKPNDDESIPNNDIEELTKEIQGLSPEQVNLIKELVKNIKH